MKRLYLRSSQGNYPILIGRNLIKSLGHLLKLLKIGRRVLVVSNQKVAKLYLAQVEESLKRSGFDVSSHLLSYGDERDKSERVLFSLWNKMAQLPLDRTSTVIALGGGVVGDVTAFAASTYMRGIALIQIPTTLLGQVDSAIGGKTAIDLPSAKNMVGTFHQPKMVLSDIDTLKTLSLSAMRQSFAEVVKYGVIKDTELFELLEKKGASFLAAFQNGKLSTKDLAFLENVVWRSSKIKAKVVSRDELETRGERVILNYGHTFAHALEASSRFSMSHGEAVAIGMTLAARLAQKDGTMSMRAEKRQRALVESLGLPIRFKKGSSTSVQLINFMKRDKKVKNGKIRFILPKAIGRVEVREGITDKQIENVLKEM